MTPAARAAIEKEGDSMQALGTWHLNSVIKKKELEAWAKAQEKKDPSLKMRLGNLLTLCGVEESFRLISYLFYGALRGHKPTQAVRVPPALHPAHWNGKYRGPYCRHIKALYGHPMSGGHRERHLPEALLQCGARPVRNHPSSFWFAEENLVDGLR